MRKYLATVALLMQLVLVLAASGLVLELKSYKVEKVKDPEGNLVEKLVPAVEVAPGDIVQWVLKARNESEGPLKGVVLVIPVPPQTKYVEGSATPLRLGTTVITPEFSYDGGQTYGKPPLKKKVKVVVQGKEVIKEVVVPPEQYTHVRWVLPELPPGHQVEVSIRTVVR